MSKESVKVTDTNKASLSKVASAIEGAYLEGFYSLECRDASGKLKWTDTVENLVVNVGKNLALDTILAGSAYTVVGPFMGLASSTVASATATDTMASKTGWTEVGGANAPAYTGGRKTVAFSAAAAGVKASTGTYTYTFTSAGSVGGVFICLGSGAVATVDSTAGVLFSVGALTGGTKAVANGDALTITYQAQM